MKVSGVDGLLTEMRAAMIFRRGLGLHRKPLRLQRQILQRAEIFTGWRGSSAKSRHIHAKGICAR